MHIESIEKYDNEFIDTYVIKRIKLPELYFKTLEASRYGAFSRKKDYTSGGAHKENEEEFLEKISRISHEKIRKEYGKLEEDKILEARREKTLTGDIDELAKNID